LLKLDGYYQNKKHHRHDSDRDDGDYTAMMKAHGASRHDAHVTEKVVFQYITLLRLGTAFSVPQELHWQ